MECPKCNGKTRQVDVRHHDNGKHYYVISGTIYRRRECTKCGFRISTIEMPVSDQPKTMTEKAKIIKQLINDLLDGIEDD